MSSAGPDFEAEQEEAITVGTYRTRDNISNFRIRIRIRKVSAKGQNPIDIRRPYSLFTSVTTMTGQRLIKVIAVLFVGNFLTLSTILKFSKLCRASFTAMSYLKGKVLLIYNVRDPVQFFCAIQFEESRSTIVREQTD